MYVHLSDAVKSTYLLTDAKALVDRGSVTYKNHTLVISRPSKPKPVEEVNESAQPPFTHEDKRGTPDEYSTGLEQTIGESTTFDVSNIPEDMSEDTLRMIFENKRFGGGGEVTNIDYEKGRGLAVITLSDPEGILSYSFIHSVLPTQSITQLVIHPCSLIH